MNAIVTLTFREIFAISVQQDGVDQIATYQFAKLDALMVHAQFLRLACATPDGLIKIVLRQFVIIA